MTSRMEVCCCSSHDGGISITSFLIVQHAWTQCTLVISREGEGEEPVSSSGISASFHSLYSLSPKIRVKRTRTNPALSPSLPSLGLTGVVAARVVSSHSSDEEEEKNYQRNRIFTSRGQELPSVKHAPLLLMMKEPNPSLCSPRFRRLAYSF